MKRIILTGNVGRDPQIRSAQDGAEFAAFSVGVSVGTKQNPKTDWVDISVNGKLVDIVRNHVRKGSKLLIDGFPSVNAYLNKENKPMATLKVFANTIEFLASKKDEEGVQSEPNSNASSDGVLPERNVSSDGVLPESDIPF